MDRASLAYARARVFEKRGLSSLQSYQPITPKYRFRLHSNPNLSQFNPSNKPEARTLCKIDANERSAFAGDARGASKTFYSPRTAIVIPAKAGIQRV